MTEANQLPLIGVSACLLGRPVRFDGGHKRCRQLEKLSDRLSFYPVCPEAELGLGIPRPTIQLREFESEIRLVESKRPQHSLDKSMRAFCEARVEKLPELDGFVLKKDSPSCGMERVPVFSDRTGQRTRKGTGLFAQAIKAHYPNLPLEEEGRLNDDLLRENFMERVFAHNRWRKVMAAQDTVKAFRDFHRRYKLMLMAKSTVDYRELGQLVSGVNRENAADVMEAYIGRFMTVMARVPSAGQHVNVLMHIMGYLKKQLDSNDKAEILDWFENYRDNNVSRVTPIALLQHHFRKHPDAYMKEQYYLQPYPGFI